MYCLTIAAVILSTIIALLLRQSKQPEPKKIFGVYSQPGKWYYLKYWVFMGILTLRKLKYYVFGKSFFHNEADLEKLQLLSDHPLAFDAVFFQAVTQDGIYIATGTERRQQAKINGLFYLVLPDYGVLMSEKLPKTTLDADPASIMSLKYYAAEGISFMPVKPMHLWKVAFKGKMRLQKDPSRLVNVEFDAEWKSDYPWFLFDVEMLSSTISRAMARETWTKEFFESLKEAHQSHYEQMGYINGKLKVDDKVISLVEMDAFRDHSFGYKRDWSLMHRYIYHMFYLSDKTKISVGVVSQPCTSTLIEMGYINHPDGKVEAVESVDLVLYQHGENGILPNELCFSFVANGVTYEVKIKYIHDAVHYVGHDRDAKMRERFLTCEVNGVPGRGISEWHYNNTNNSDTK